jgi:hypothetical protein
MPIRPSEKLRYPKDWPAISKRIRERAGNKCEKCGVPNGVYRNKTTGETTTNLMQVETWDLCDGDKIAKIVLTVGHLNHIPEDCRDENLKAWCQKCHRRYDRDHHQTNARRTRDSKTGQGSLNV